MCFVCLFIIRQEGKCGLRPLPLRHLWPRPERGGCLAVDLHFYLQRGPGFRTAGPGLTHACCEGGPHNQDQ